MEGGPPRFSPRFTGADLLRNTCGRSCNFVYGTIALCGARFHALRLSAQLCNFRQVGSRLRPGALQPPTGNACPLAPVRFGLIPFRSPLLRESRLIFFPRGTEGCFTSPAWSSPRLCVQRGITPHYRRWVSHSGIRGVTGYSAPHRGLSQPSTSFFDSWCQGIHRVLLTILTVIFWKSDGAPKRPAYRSPRGPKAALGDTRYIGYCAVFKVRKEA